ncbi:hemerythrin-like domain-containing protein [Kitasatospora sp. MAP12-15]|uniref:hemerythrin domain-containing protein n=1 Tax=unclassified Kitasatospora TaxID=2633591 RepID=UPI002476D8DE|nr:hemerythrin domain-containing protein [Kitasatospora sp. MAP12-44]MDH6108970.1 hemerythrin-like domain-containing protein [Kitasatospora sp. MAP12-44]
MSNDAIVLLKEDRKEILRLFGAYRAYLAQRDAGGADHAAGADLADRIVHLLTVHTYLEDEVLYPRLRALLSDPEHEVLRSYQQHRTADQLCEELSAQPPDGEPPEVRAARDARIVELIDTVSRRIEEEEREWFPLVRGAVSRKALQDIGTQLLAVRETAPRPSSSPSGFQDSPGGTR